MIKATIHPGEILSEELAVLGITQTQLAHSINVPVNRISKIIAGKRSVTADTALRLGKWFGTGPTFWLNLQQTYDINLTESRIETDLKNIESRSVV